MIMIKKKIKKERFRLDCKKMNLIINKKIISGKIKRSATLNVQIRRTVMKKQI